MKDLSILAAEFFDAFDGAELPEGFPAGDLPSFKKSLKDFLSSGSKEDAFCVYYCFSEIFSLFGKGYDNTRKLLETLSDHEYHSGELLAKHRDHYSHSAYVFAIGLAIYACVGRYRSNFLAFYGLDDDAASAVKFLKLWGITSLFHDIGYPFQLAHEQIKTYTRELWGEAENNPFVSFGNIMPFIAIDGDRAEAIAAQLGTDRRFADINELLAYGVSLRLGYDEKVLRDMLYKRVISQPKFMDHGYFSSVILLRQLFAMPQFVLDGEHLDVITAILLHNSLNKFEYRGEDAHPVAVSEHPLACLLMLCDELQNWDRLAYGKVSKRDPVAWNVAFSMDDGGIEAEYYFDSPMITGADDIVRLNGSFDEIQRGIFVGNIRKYIDFDINIEARAVQRNKKRRTRLFASDNCFINLCDFAVAINAGYNRLCRSRSKYDLINEFGDLSLEFKMSNINQAKSYAEKLELVNCFYSGKDLDYPVVNNLRDNNYGVEGSDNFGFLCREEHVRWVKEKLEMGWRYGNDYKTNAERNSRKVHRCLVPYEELDDEDRDKDAVMIENIIPLLRKFGNNTRIYSYRSGRKPDLLIAGFGHRYYKDNEGTLKEQIKKVLLGYNEYYRVVVRTGFAYGADQLIIESALELGLSVKAALPQKYEDFVKSVREDAVRHHRKYTDEDEYRLRHLLAQTVVCKSFTEHDDTRYSATDYNLAGCNAVIALYDADNGVMSDDDPSAFSGTYECLKMAKERLADSLIHIIHCHKK